MAIWTFTRRDCKRRPHRDKAVAVIWVHLFGSYSGKARSIHVTFSVGAESQRFHQRPQLGGDALFIAFSSR